MKSAVGAAKIIRLTSPEDSARGFALELRHLLDGTVSIRVFEPGHRAGIAVPGNTVVTALAGAFARCAELTVSTRLGIYRFRRELTWVRVGYASFDGTWDHEWTASLAEFLAALKSFGRAAA